MKVGGWIKMTKYTEEFEDQFKDLKDVGKATKTILEDGEELAFKEIYTAKSYAKLKRRIKELY